MESYGQTGGEGIVIVNLLVLGAAVTIVGLIVVLCLLVAPWALLVLVAILLVLAAAVGQARIN